MAFRSWAHYKRITISSTVAVTDYQLRFTVNRSTGTDSEYTLYVGTDCNADYSDIRFTKADNETELSYFIEPEYTSSVAYIWVKLDSIPTDGTTFNMHYGNPDATATTSSISNTFATYVTNQTSTYNVSGSVAYSVRCVGSVTTTSSSFDIAVGILGSTYYKCTGSTPSYGVCEYTDEAGYHVVQLYAYPWSYPNTHTFMIVSTNDDTDFYHDGVLRHHVDYGIASPSGIGLYGKCVSGATVNWCGIAKYTPQVSAPSNIVTVDRVYIDNAVDVISANQMYQSCTTELDNELTLTFQMDVVNIHYRLPSGYKDRKKIVLTNSATYDIDEFQMIFTIYRSAGTDYGSAIYVGSDCLSTYADIMFTSDSGIMPLSHYIIPPSTSSSSKVLVKIPHIDASGTCTIYIYYNNPDAVSTSNKDATVVNAIVNSCCESISGWTRFNNGGYSGGYMNAFELASDFHTEGSYSILACAYSIWSSSAYTEIGQNISLDIGTEYKLYYDMRIGVSDYGSNVVTIRTDDVVRKTYTMNGSGNTDYYGDYITFTPTTSSTKLSWYANTTGSSGNTCMRIDNLILIKNISSVTVLSYTHEYMGLIYNTIDLSITSRMQLCNESLMDMSMGVSSSNSRTSILAVRNGDLECGMLEGWEYDPEEGAWSIAASAAHSGNYGAQCDCTEYTLHTVEIPITIDTAETLSIWFQIPIIELNEEDSVYFEIYLYTSGYDYVDTIYSDVIDSDTEPCTWVNATYDVSLLGGEFIIIAYIDPYFGDGGEMS